jgi:Secretin and TonB N terminus short domain
LISTLARSLALSCVLSAIVPGGVYGQSRSRSDDRREVPTSLRAISLHWDQVPLSEAVERLARALQHPIFVDRRVDPTRRVSFSARDLLPDAVLAGLAADLSLGVSRLESVDYLGPPETARELRTLAELRRDQVRHLPPAERKVLLARNSLSWPRLAEPRQIIADMLEADGWTVRHAELIPHDLWPASQLPPMSLSDRLTLLLAGFDLTFVPVGGQQAIEVQPIRRPVTLARTYRVSAARMPTPEVLRQELPDARWQVRGSQLAVAGRLEDHERLLELLGRRPAQPRRSTRTVTTSTQTIEQRYTLRVDQQPVGAVLRPLGRQLGWNFHIDQAAIDAAGLSLDQRVSFSVQDATIDRLLDALLKPAGLTYQLDGQELTVVPRAADE